MGRARTVTNELKLGNLVHILYKLNNYQYADGVEAIGPLLKENVNKNYHDCQVFFLADHLWPDLVDAYLYSSIKDGVPRVNSHLRADIYGRPQNTELMRSGGRSFQREIIKRIKNGDIKTLVSHIQATLCDAEYVSFESGIRQFLSKVPEAEAREKNERYQINATILKKYIGYINSLFTSSDNIEECYAKVIAWLIIGCILRDRLSEIQDIFQYEYISIPITNISEKYIFISYAHKDSHIVLPILRRMSQDGYAIWYDNHISAASEWDDSIAEHIENSSYVISFISKNYIESENCMDELKYARDEKKKPLLIFLEDLSLTGGLAMRLNRHQHIHHYKYINDEMFFRKLYGAEGINICSISNKVTPEDNFIVSDTTSSTLASQKYTMLIQYLKNIQRNLNELSYKGPITQTYGCLRGFFEAGLDSLSFVKKEHNENSFLFDEKQNRLIQSQIDCIDDMIDEYISTFQDANDDAFADIVSSMDKISLSIHHFLNYYQDVVKEFIQKCEK